MLDFPYLHCHFDSIGEMNVGGSQVHCPVLFRHRSTIFRPSFPVMESFFCTLAKMLQISLIQSNTRSFPFFSSRKQLLFDSQSHQTSSSAPPQLWLRKGRIVASLFITLVLTWSVAKFSSHQLGISQTCGSVVISIPLGMYR